jgi:hypothetical protein
MTLTTDREGRGFASRQTGFKSDGRGAPPKSFMKSVGMRLVRIQPGSFLMGQDGPAADYQMTRHPTKIDDANWDTAPKSETRK